MNTILLTGGTGKTGRRIAEKLLAANMKVRLASRSALPVEQCESVRFDWVDAATYETALKDVRAIYLLAPSNVAEPLEVMRPFINYALEKGVARFVLLSASSLPKGGPMMGAVHAYLEKTVPEWTALRPTWFMQNFSEQQHRDTIRAEGCIYSATGNGRVPFIDAEDIAAVAAEALIRKVSLNREVILTGPEALTYNEVAQAISTVTNRQIRHVKLSEEQLKRRFIHSGMAPLYAKALSAMDTAISNGSEDYCSDEVKAITGKAPRSFAQFTQKACDSWLT